MRFIGFRIIIVTLAFPQLNQVLVCVLKFILFVDIGGHSIADICPPLPSIMYL